MMHQPSGKTPRVPGDLERNELPRFFPGFDVVEYTEADDTAEWFNARLRIARFVARKR